MANVLEAPPEVRDRLAIALDVGDLDAALAMARTVAPWFGVAKVGYELYGEAGPVAFARLRDLGFAVFCDLKLHDIPNTVQRGAAALARVAEAPVRVCARSEPAASEALMFWADSVRKPSPARALSLPGSP